MWGSIRKAVFHHEVVLVTLYSKRKASLVAQMVKNLPAMQETWIWFLGWEDPIGGNGNPL